MTGWLTIVITMCVIVLIVVAITLVILRAAVLWLASRISLEIERQLEQLAGATQ